MSRENNSSLPDSWAITVISNVAEVNPKSNRPNIADDLQVSFVPMPAIEAESGVIDVTATRPFGEVKKGYTAFLEGDVLFAKITPCMENGKMAVIPALKNGLGFGSTEFHVLRALEGVAPKYLYYFVSSKRFRYDAEHNMTGAVGQKRVPTNYISGSEIPVPPSKEQHRIVDKIEELFSELDKGIESLKTAREQLKVYRRTVLKHAFEGKLTAQWREEYKDKLVSPVQLLARIQQDREDRNKQELQDWFSAVKLWEQGGRQGKRPTKPREGKSSTPLSIENLIDLPRGWAWAKLGAVSDCLDNLRVPINKNERRLRNGEIPYYGANGQVGWIDDYLFDEPLILLVEDETFTGREKPFSYKIAGKSWVNNHAHILRPEAGVNIDYLNFQLFYYPFTEITTGTTGRKKLTQDAMINAPIRVCSSREQIEIAERLESTLSEIDRLDQIIVRSLIQFETLRQSILEKAFAGQLVPQDKSEEPASKLLECVRAGIGIVSAKR